jgi:rod shape-determining protein MreC
MPRLVRNRIFTLVIITLLLMSVLLLSSLPGSPLNFVTTPVSAILKPVQSFFQKTADKVSGFFESISDGMRIRNENQTLRDENASLRSQIAQLEEAGRQYQELKSALSLVDQFDHYQILGARVMTREIGTWFDVFRLDAGTKDGLLVTETASFAVVDANSNLIGRILSADALSAKVLPLLHEGFTVSAKINVVNGPVLRLRGDYDLKPLGLCLADQIPANAVIRVGDELVTSGTGGLFPAGIPIGKVVKVIDNEARNLREAYVEPYADLQNLTAVFILKGKEE